VGAPVKLYSELAEWWPLFSSPADYEEEAAFYGDRLLEAGDAPAATLLELGSGGGNNASFLKRRFRMTLVDPAPGMLEVSRRLNPECEHVEGDMRTCRLARQFDRVFIHDAICFMTTEADLRAALETAYLHTRPGGGVLVAPDHVKENFRPGTDDGGEDGDGRAIRFLEWSWDPDPSDSVCTVDYAFLLRERDGAVRVLHERQVEGLFPRALWLNLMTDVGFVPEAIVFDHSELDPGSYELFRGVRPVSSEA